MAYKFDNYDNALVLDGVENGIADSPYLGIADMRNVNIISIPGEASVNFATAQISSAQLSGVTVTSLSGSTIGFSGGATGLQNRMAIYFTQVGGLTGITTYTPYWVASLAGSPSSPTSCVLYSDYSETMAVTIGGAATGSPMFSTYNVGMYNGTFSKPKYSTYVNYSSNQYYFMQDGLGQVWSNRYPTTAGGGITQGFWTYVGPSGSSDTGGNGISGFNASDGTAYVFAFRNSSIDYFSLQTNSWVYGWNPNTGTAGNTAGYITQGIHMAFVAFDSQLYYCNGTSIGRFYEKDPSVAAFNPTVTSTYVADNTRLLSNNDTAQCLSFLGNNILIGGINNIVYPWDRSSSTASYPILLAESNITNMVTINTNTYIFVGNRGRIYVTNGSNAQLYKKVPDHISGTVEPYFTWGGVATIKNQIYFSCIATTNAGGVIAQYGGVWAIDADTDAMRLTNKLSYGTYAGYSPTMIPNFSSNAAGTGLFIGWDNGSFGYGIDTTISTPYTGSQATIDFDLIPIGTFNKPRDLTQIEYKLTEPLVANESITINQRLIFGTQNTGYTTVFTDSTAGNYSNTGYTNFLNAQWVQFQVVLNSTGASPSYTRFKQLRILGATGPTLASNQQLGI